MALAISSPSTLRKIFKEVGFRITFQFMFHFVFDGLEVEKVYSGAVVYNSMSNKTWFKNGEQMENCEHPYYISYCQLITPRLNYPNLRLGP